HRRAERELRDAMADKNLRVQAAADAALSQLRTRRIEPRCELSADSADVPSEPVEVAAAPPAINPEPAHAEAAGESEPVIAASTRAIERRSTAPAVPVRGQTPAATRPAVIVPCESVEDRGEKVVHAEGREPIADEDSPIADTRIVLIDSQEQ